MAKKEIKSIILYLDSAVAIDYLTDEQAGILFKSGRATTCDCMRLHATASERMP